MSAPPTGQLLSALPTIALLIDEATADITAHLRILPKATEQLEQQ